jgi:hypothetical protein
VLDDLNVLFELLEVVGLQPGPGGPVGSCAFRRDIHMAISSFKNGIRVYVSVLVYYSERGGSGGGIREEAETGKRTKSVDGIGC